MWICTVHIEPSTLHAIEAAGEDAPAILRAALGGIPRGRIGIVSSFGTESAVLLALAAEIDPSVPVLFLETGQHFPETLAYRDQLVERLGLTDVRNIHPDPAQIKARDPQGQLWAFDPDACCALRKVEPLDEAIIPFDAWITGRKRSQAATRALLPRHAERPAILGGERGVFPGGDAAWPDCLHRCGPLAGSAGV